MKILLLLAIISVSSCPTHPKTHHHFKHVTPTPTPTPGPDRPLKAYQNFEP